MCLKTIMENNGILNKDELKELAGRIHNMCENIRDNVSKQYLATAKIHYNLEEIKGGVND